MPGMKGVELLEIVDRRLADDDQDPADRPGRPRRGGRARSTARTSTTTSPSRGTRPRCGSRSRTCCASTGWTDENQQLIATLSAKNQALLEMNRELEAKIHERTHELAEANTRLAQLAVTDGLTGLYNHRHFHERLTLEVERRQRSGLPLSLLMIDVDHFKQYNDTHGHPAGDEVLRQLARAARRRPPRQRRGRALRRRGVRGDPGRHGEVHRRQGRRARPRARRRPSLRLRRHPARRPPGDLGRRRHVPRRRRRSRRPAPRRRHRAVRRQARRPRLRRAGAVRRRRSSNRRVDHVAS